jgi:nitrogen regulatory protein PII-like uncharacterized protein
VRNDHEVIIDAIQTKLCRREDITDTLEKYKFKLLCLDHFIELVKSEDPEVIKDLLRSLKKENSVIVGNLISDDGSTDVKGYSDMQLIFSPDGEKVIDIEIPAINIFEGFINEDKYKGKRSM